MDNLTNQLIVSRLTDIKKSLPTEVTLVAVSKTHPADAILTAYNAGQRIFGENKVQEMTLKQKQLPQDIEWHFIGHVQKNKIRMMAPYVSVIQGVDSFDSLEEINRQASIFGRNITCLLQLHIATEESKFGFVPSECMDILEKGEWKKLNNITIGGVMGMATFTDDIQQVLREFKTLVNFYNTAKKRFFADDNNFRTISAGMSEDYETAIQAGSNMIRIGSNIFGARDYSKQ
jgi:PLP dependent protein